MCVLIKSLPTLWELFFKNRTHRPSDDDVSNLCAEGLLCVYKYIYIYIIFWMKHIGLTLLNKYVFIPSGTLCLVIVMINVCYLSGPEQ